MTPPLQFPAEMLAAHPYVPDWLGVDARDLIRLDRNECNRPLSDHVAQALADHVSTNSINRYPEDAAIRSRLADYCSVTPEFVLPTNGSDQGIDICLRAFLGHGKKLLVARPEFPVFGHIAELLGVTIAGVDYEPDLSFPYQRFREAATARPALILLINPNNPTGTAVRRDFIEEMVRTYPDTPILVDEAYYEFTGNTVVDLVSTFDNLIVLRTFSKAFGMAGLRFGYVVAQPQTIEQLTKLRNPFDVNQLAMVAAAASLAELAVVQRDVLELMTEVKPMVANYLAGTGATVFPGSANFVLVKPPTRDATQVATCDALVQQLRENRILVRTMKAPQIRGMFRVSIGTRSEMEYFIKTYEAIHRQ